MKKLQCDNCGASLDWDGQYGKAVECPYCGSRFLPSPTEVDDVWLMTDPVARSRYEFQTTLDQLEHDIRYEVLRGGTWSELDRAYLHEIERLEKAGLVRRLASFWAISPHPPIYRALADGELVIGGRRYSFRKEQEIVWACPMARDRFNLDGPVLISDFQSERVQRLCGEMANAMMGRMAR
jgi:DNA-directed RNA polymerase subunit RPC12/RpoP